MHWILIRAGRTIAEIPGIGAGILTRIYELEWCIVTDAGGGSGKTRSWRRRTRGSPRTYETARGTRIV